MIELTREPIDAAALTQLVRRPHCGAVATFLGTVRDITGDQVTVRLDYEAYAEMALAKLREIDAECRERWKVGDLAIVHRLGTLDVGEISVAVAVSTPHRADAFDACRHVIERIKEIAPIWKRDHAPDGTAEWVHQ